MSGRAELRRHRAVCAALAATLALAGCREREERAFAAVQDRGRVAMGVDQYTSAHVFDPLPDGGRILLQRAEDDSAGTATIREHMAYIAAAFSEGDFRLPGFVHDREVPGTAVMAAKRAAISYTADSVPRGGQLRIRSADPEAVRAIHQFLAFQRHDHRAGDSH